VRGREQRQRSLQDIAETTKIAIHQLRSLERGDLHRLPGGLYRRAIVRQYAAAVGLNVEDTLAALATIEREIDIDDQALHAGAARSGDAGSSLFSTALWSSATPLVLVGAVAALAVGWYQLGTTRPAADAPVTAASAPTAQANVPPSALVARTEAVRATAGDIQLGTASAVVQKEPETVNVADADATEGELRITSEPTGALVTVNGVGWGPTPVTIRYMPFGKKLIRVTKPGYASAQRGVDFVPDRRVQSVRIQLSAEPDTR
jgi:cytoskeletal protein RodZ